MNPIPTLKEAQSLLEEYNQEPFHLKHAKIVSGVLGYFAKEYDPEQEDFWRAAGLLHDLDFEKFPEQHCIKGKELMEERGLDPRLIHAMMSHGWNLTTDVKPEHIMEKILYATDELTGLIGAVAIMRPSKSVSDLELKSVKKKFKDKKFAAGCSREIISQGAERLGWTLEDLFEKTILAMRDYEDKVEEEMKEDI